MKEEPPSNRTTPGVLADLRSPAEPRRVGSIWEWGYLNVFWIVFFFFNFKRGHALIFYFLIYFYIVLFLFAMYCNCFFYIVFNFYYNCSVFIWVMFYLVRSIFLGAERTISFHIQLCCEVCISIMFQHITVM